MNSLSLASAVDFDVIIVGGGIAGLACARKLKAENNSLSVLILEGRNRVGGRTLTDSKFNHTAVDIGGQWIGPTQHLVLKLAQELGLELEEQIWFEDGNSSSDVHTNDSGKSDSAGCSSLCSGTSVELSSAEQMELTALSARLDALAKEVSGPPNWHKNSSELQHLDTMSAHDYLTSLCQHANVLHELQMLVQTVLAVDTTALSALYLLYVVGACGGLAALGDGPNGAQKWKVKGGAQLLCLRMLDDLLQQQQQQQQKQCQQLEGHQQHGGFEVRYNSPVTNITAASTATGSVQRCFFVSYGTTVNTAAIAAPDAVEAERTKAAAFATVSGRHIVIAMAPPLWTTMAFHPELPPSKLAIARGMVRGRAIKIVTVFNSAFWEIKSAEEGGVNVDIEPRPLLEKCGLIANLFPSRLNGYPALVGLITGEKATNEYMALSPAARRTSVAAQLKIYFQWRDDIDLSLLSLQENPGESSLHASDVEEANKDAVVDPNVHYCGCNSVKVLYFVDKVWCSGYREDLHAETTTLAGAMAAAAAAAEEEEEAQFNSGCFAAVMPPGLCLAHGNALLNPIEHPYSNSTLDGVDNYCGKVHFACTELAAHWPGYFEGAVESGCRAATDILS